MKRSALLVLAALLLAGPAWAGGAVPADHHDVVVRSALDGAPAQTRLAQDGSLDGALLAQNSRRRRYYRRSERYDDDDDDDYAVRSRRPKNRYVRRRNIAIGATALGAITGSGLLTGIGIGGIVANEFSHRDRVRGVR